MSFLNPISLPVMRFSSTDVDAPQIDYANRAAGDIKTVLKACLVTGYGDKQGAGWTIQNEDDFIAEFVSPDVAMSDYRLCIDDVSASKTSWYYNYQETRTDPDYNAPIKNIRYIDKSSPDNGWQLLVTDRGLCFIEMFFSTAVQDTFCRITYFGQAKSMLINDEGKNLVFFNYGWNSTSSTPNNFFNNTVRYLHFHFANYSTGKVTYTGTMLGMMRSNADWTESAVEMSAPMFFYSAYKIIAEQPAFLFKKSNKNDGLYGAYDTSFADRKAIHVCTSNPFNNKASVLSYISRALIYTDFWEF